MITLEIFGTTCLDSDHTESLAFFPNGELNLAQHKRPVREISFKYDSDADLMHLLLLSRHLKHINESYGRPAPGLILSYMPYSRMDRDAEGGSSCALRYIGEYIQSLNFGYISVCEPHSELTMAYLGEKATVDQLFVENRIFNLPETTWLAFPDAGAYKRYAKLGKGRKTVTFSKMRDFDTGRIVSMSIDGDVDLTGKEICIVDDLCSYGGTFKTAAEYLKKRGASKVTLLVTHCEDNILKGDLLKDDSPLDGIETTDSILRISHPKIKVEKVFELSDD